MLAPPPPAPPRKGEGSRKTGRRLTISAALAALAAPFATPAHAQEAFDLFEAMCLKNRADSVAALKVADSLGWGVVPEPVVRLLDRNATFTQAQMRTRGPGLEQDLLIVGRRAEEIRGRSVSVQMCMITSKSTDLASKNRVAAWAGVPADAALGRGRKDAYIFFDEGGRHRDAGATDLKTIDLKGRGLTSVAFQSDDNGSLMIIAIVE